MRGMQCSKDKKVEKIGGDTLSLDPRIIPCVPSPPGASGPFVFLISFVPF